MKTLLALLMCVALGSAASAQSPKVNTNQFLTFTSKSGRGFTNAEVRKVTDKGLLLAYERGGMGNIPFEELPDWVLAKWPQPAKTNRTYFVKGVGHLPLEVKNTVDDFGQQTQMIMRTFDVPHRNAYVMLTLVRDANETTFPYTLALAGKGNEPLGFIGPTLVINVDGTPITLMARGVGQTTIDGIEAGIYAGSIPFFQTLGRAKKIKIDLKGPKETIPLEIQNWTEAAVFANYCLTNHGVKPQSADLTTSHVGNIMNSQGTQVGGMIVSNPSYRIVEKNTIFWRFSYQFKVRNVSSASGTSYITIQFLDDEGFIIKEAISPVRLPMGESDTIRGDSLIDFPICQQVRLAVIKPK